MVILRLLLCPLLCLSCLVSLQAAEANWEFPAGIVPNVIIRAKIVLKNLPGQLKAWDQPEIEGLEFLDMQSGGYMRRTINGVTTEEQTLLISMRFDKIGTYTFPEITFTTQNGHTIKSKAIEVKVIDNPVATNADCYAVASVDQKSVVPGQQFTLHYKVALRLGKRYRIKQQLGLQLPESSIRVGDIRADDPVLEYDNEGNTWQVSNYYIDLKLPDVGEYTFGGQQSYGRAQKRIFNEYYQEVGQVAIKPARIQVSPLPTDGQPKHFAGLIGPVALTAQVDNERIALGKNVILELNASDGQVEMLGSIHIPPIEGLTIYEGEQRYDEETDTKTYFWTIVPKREGNYIIPAIEVPYYDSSARRYHSVKSQPISLTVIPGKQRDLGAVGVIPQTNSNAQTSGVGMLLPSPFFGNAATHIKHSTPWWGLLSGFVIGILICAGLASIFKRKQHGPDLYAQLTNAIQSNDLDAANRYLHQLMPRLKGQAATDAERCIQAVEQARFGKQTLPAEIQTLIKGLAS